MKTYLYVQKVNDLFLFVNETEYVFHIFTLKYYKYRLPLFNNLVNY